MMALLGVAGGFALMMARGFCFVVLWRWFIVPLGAPAIGVAHGLGLGTVVGMLIPQPTKTDDNPAWLTLVGALVGLLLLMLIAWIIHAAMIA